MSVSRTDGQTRVAVMSKDQRGQSVALRLAARQRCTDGRVVPQHFNHGRGTEPLKAILKKHVCELELMLVVCRAIACHFVRLQLHFAMHTHRMLCVQLTEVVTVRGSQNGMRHSMDLLTHTLDVSAYLELYSHLFEGLSAGWSGCLM